MRWMRRTRRSGDPAGRRTRLRLGAVASGLLLAGGMAVASAPAAGADQSIPVGVSGNLRFGPPPNGFPPLDAALVQLTGVTALVDDSGNFTVPAGVAIGSEPNPPAGVPNLLLHTSPITGVRVVAQSPLTGSIDAGSMTMRLSGQLSYVFVLGSVECGTQPQSSSFTSTSLDLATETATLVPDSNFSVPATARGTPNCPDDQAQLVDSLLQLPTAPNNAALTLTLSLTPNGPPATPPPSSDPGTTPPSASPGSTGSAVLGSSAAPKASKSSKSSSSKSSKTTGAKSSTSGTTANGDTTTSATQFEGVTPRIDDGGSGGTPNAVAAPHAPQSTAKIGEPGSNSFGVGVIALIVAGLLGAVFLLRSEGRRLFRRRDHAAF